MTTIDTVIASGSIPGTTATDPLSGNTTSTTTAASGGTSGGASGTTSGPHAVSTHTASAGASGAGGGSSSSSGAAAAQMLRQLIARLQQMLAKVEAQIAATATRHGPGGSPDPALGALQTEASAIQGQISAAAAKMVELGQTVGGLVNDQA